MRRRVAPTSHYFRRCHQPKNRPVAIPTSVGAARSCQIVMLNSVSVILPPLLQWQRFAAILNLSRVKLAPVMLPVNTEQRAGFSLSSDKATGDQAPQHCASPGCPGLPLILLCSPVSAGLKNKNPNLAIGIPVTMYALQDVWGWRQTPGLKNVGLHPTYETNNSFILRIPLGGAKRNLTFNSTNSFVSSLLISFCSSSLSDRQTGYKSPRRHLLRIFPGNDRRTVLIGFGIFRMLMIVAVEAQ